MVRDYHGNTFVAFLDVLGFRDTVKNDISLAAHILDKFYGTIYDTSLNLTVRSADIDRNSRGNTTILPGVNMIVASDCAVIFSRNTESGENLSNDLECVLKFISEVNNRLIKSEPSPSVLTTCSIAYGQFTYEDRRDSGFLRKNCFFGMPYMRAFSDSEKMKNKPGLCRLLRDGMPHNVPKLSHFLVKKDKNYYFYWMLRNPRLLDDFLVDYKEANRIKGQAKYERIKEVLQRYSARANQSNLTC
jgi:hypothetical protein